MLAKEFDDPTNNAVIAFFLSHTCTNVIKFKSPQRGQTVVRYPVQNPANDIRGETNKFNRFYCNHISPHFCTPVSTKIKKKNHGMDND